MISTRVYPSYCRPSKSTRPRLLSLSPTAPNYLGKSPHSDMDMGTETRPSRTLSKYIDQDSVAKRVIAKILIVMIERRGPSEVTWMEDSRI